MNPHGFPRRDAQRGMALIVALILLVVVTLLGVSGLQGTGLQERMSGNLYDRSLSMQAAEAALRAARAELEINPDLGIDCTAESGNQCPTIPDNTFTGSSGAWANTPQPFIVNPGLSAGTAQYHIAILGDGGAEETLPTANCDQYGGPACDEDTTRFYRITTRSHDPTIAGLEHRSLVVLQAVVQLAN